MRRRCLAVQPSPDLIDTRYDLCSAWCPDTMRTVRSRTSGEQLVGGSFVLSQPGIAGTKRRLAENLRRLVEDFTGKGFLQPAIPTDPQNTRIEALTFPGTRASRAPLSFPRKRESTSITKVSGFPLSRE